MRPPRGYALALSRQFRSLPLIYYLTIDLTSVPIVRTSFLVLSSFTVSFFVSAFCYIRILMTIIKKNCDLGGNLAVSCNRKSANTARNALEKSKKVRQLYLRRQAQPRPVKHAQQYDVAQVVAYLSQFEQAYQTMFKLPSEAEAKTRFLCGMTSPWLTRLKARGIANYGCLESAPYATVLAIAKELQDVQ